MAGIIACIAGTLFFRSANAMALCPRANMRRVANVRSAIDLDELARVCGKHHIFKLWLFGSVLGDDFRSDSDVDVLVEFEDGYSPELSGLLKAQSDLSRLFHREVDLVERPLVECSRNYIRRQHILSSMEPLYVAR